MIGSLFSGIGGLELGLEWAGLGPVAWQVEMDPWCRGVLAMHWPEAERHADVRSVGAHNLDEVEVMCGGFPCQDVSIAGKNAGLDGHRSGLWGEFARIIGELRPRIVVVENVPALVSRGLDRVTADLDGLAYRVEARIVAASDVGAPHRRERLFVIAANTVCAYCRGTGEAWDVDEGPECPACRVADTNGERIRLEQQRMPRGRAGGVRASWEGESFEHCTGKWAGAKPRMGRGAYGIPAGMDRWPSRPGEPPAIWEPPMSTDAFSPTRDQRNKALGNAVVPQVAYQIGLHVREIMARHIE